MSYTLKHIYTKPNADVTIGFWNTDILNLIDTYFDAGKITQKPVKSEDGLKETYTTIFKDETSFNEFIAESVSISNKNALDTFCDNNNVICDIEKG